MIGVFFSGHVNQYLSLNAGTMDDGFLSDAGVAASSTGASSGVPFAGMLQSMVQQTSALDQKASQAVTGLLNGSGVKRFMRP